MSPDDPSAPPVIRIAMLYSWDWSHEFDDHRSGLVPAHRLFGAAELSGLGHKIATCKWGRVPVFLRRRQIWKVWQALWLVAHQRRVDCVIATTEAPALPALLLRSIKLLGTPVIVLSVAILTDKYLEGIGGLARRVVLRRASYVVVYASEQVPQVARYLGVESSCVRFLPFGVDVEFFRPSATAPRFDVVSVGTNEGKDFPTLIAALPAHSSCLIVTDALNAPKVAKTPTEGEVTLDHDVPIVELREIYAAARRHVIPLRDVLFSSGQTVLLENLAMGRPVIVSDTAASRDYVTAEVATIIKPEDVPAMRRALSASPPASVPAASRHVREHFTSDRFAADLAALCREATSR